MTNPGSQRTTIYDVAELAGVAASTVSRALNRPDRVSFHTAEKVRIAAEQLGYKAELRTPIIPESSTPKPLTGYLGLVAADLSNPFFIEILRGAEHAAHIADFQIISINTNESGKRARRAVETLLPHVDGMLLVSTRMSSGEIQKYARTKPTAVINRPVPGVPSVLVNNYDGAIQAAVHLAEQGCRSITYLGGPEESWADASRWRGLLDIVGRSDTSDGIDVLPRSTTLQKLGRLHRMQLKHIKVPMPNSDGGRQAFEQWQKHPTDAVLCFNDLVALGFIQKAKASGISVPTDVAVVGFDNTELTAMSAPSLTTVGGPLRTMGRVASANLIALLKGIKGAPPKPRILPTRLIVRDSSQWRN